jgi:PPOX class probable F420-dependent enzyme
MTDDETAAFLADANVAILGTVDSLNRPHAAPVWYLYDNGEIVISTGRGSQKHRNVERNPNVSVVADKRELPYYAVMIQGTAEIGPRLSESDRLRLAVRYLGDALGSRYAEMTKDEDSITLRIKPRKTTVYDSRRMRD